MERMAQLPDYDDVLDEIHNQQVLFEARLAHRQEGHHWAFTQGPRRCQLCTLQPQLQIRECTQCNLRACEACRRLRV